MVMPVRSLSKLWVMVDPFPIAHRNDANWLIDCFQRSTVLVVVLVVCYALW